MKKKKEKRKDKVKDIKDYTFLKKKIQVLIH